jgi:hypothetical protein
VHLFLLRLLIVILVGIVLPLASPEPAAAQTQRKSINALTAPELASLRRGVAVMMARNTAPRNSADFRRSWVYWANMHAHFGASCRGPKTGGNMATVQLWNANNANERATWCKCEHGTEHFLTWHRMFLFYFERVLQQAAGDPSLRLPYWDYATDPRLPAAFRATTYVDDYGASLANPLRVAQRRPALNNGTAGLAAGTSSAANAMAAGSYATFGARIEQGPHGPVHCALSANGCPNGLMGSVPASALDPIFYLHHTNIDRLYECWLQVNPGGRLPGGGTMLNRQYSFVDRDGAVRTRYVRDMLTTEQLGYGYTDGAGCPAGAANAVMAGSGPTSLGAGQTTVPMAVESTLPESAPAAAARPRQTVTVIIEGFSVRKVPDVIYNVYIANAAGQRALLGVIDFFGFDGAGASAGGHKHVGAGGRRLEFDATAAFTELGLRADRQPQLIFEPTTGLTDSTPEAAARWVQPGAEVRFTRARVRVDPATD